MDNPLLNRFARQNRLNPNETNHDPLTRSLIDGSNKYTQRRTKMRLGFQIKNVVNEKYTETLR